MTKNETAEMKTIQIGKFELRYHIEGSGIPAIVIGSAIYYPRTFSLNLRKNLQLVFVDHRGFANYTNTLEAAACTLDNILDDIEHIRKSLNIPSAIIIGHSGHGYMALEYAKRYPDSVSHLVLLAMSPDGSSKSVEAADRYFQESASPERKALLAKNLTKLQTEVAANPTQAFITRALLFIPMTWYNFNFDAHDLWKDVTVNPEIMDYLWGKVFHEMDITKQIDKLNCPVFLGLGRYDYWNPPYLWESIRHHFTNLTIRIFEKSGHTPQYEEPELFDQELLRWLNSHS